MQNLVHPNIIQLFEFNVTQLKKKNNIIDFYYSVLEFAPKGTLFQYVFEKGCFSERVARKYFKELILAMEFCHINGICHRDLKLENLLLDSNYKLKLADFGFSTLISGKDGSGKLKTQLGTKTYMAPEIVMNLPYSGVSVDVFAAGVILFLMVSGHHPFKCADPKDEFFKLLCINKHNNFWNFHSKGLSNAFSKEIKSLLNTLLAFDSTQRLSISEIKAHEWFTQEGASDEEIIELFEGSGEKKMEINKDMVSENDGKLVNYVHNNIESFKNRDIDIKEKDNLEKKLEIKREISEKNEKIQIINDLYIKADKDFLFNLLSKFSIEKLGKTKISENKYKIKCKLISEIENLKFKIVLKIAKDNLVCIEFIKKKVKKLNILKGILLEFHENVKKIKDFLESLVKIDEKKYK